MFEEVNNIHRTTHRNWFQFTKIRYPFHTSVSSIKSNQIRRLSKTDYQEGQRLHAHWYTQVKVS